MRYIITAIFVIVTINFTFNSNVDATEQPRRMAEEVAVRIVTGLTPNDLNNFATGETLYLDRWQVETAQYLLNNWADGTRANTSMKEQVEGFRLWSHWYVVLEPRQREGYATRFVAPLGDFYPKLKESYILNTSDISNVDLPSELPTLAEAMAGCPEEPEARREWLRLKAAELYDYVANVRLTAGTDCPVSANSFSRHEPQPVSSLSTEERDWLKRLYSQYYEQVAPAQKEVEKLIDEGSLGVEQRLEVLKGLVVLSDPWYTPVDALPEWEDVLNGSVTFWMYYSFNGVLPKGTGVESMGFAWNRVPKN